MNKFDQVIFRNIHDSKMRQDIFKIIDDNDITPRVFEELLIYLLNINNPINKDSEVEYEIEDLRNDIISIDAQIEDLEDEKCRINEEIVDLENNTIEGRKERIVRFKSSLNYIKNDIERYKKEIINS